MARKSTKDKNKNLICDVCHRKFVSVSTLSRHKLTFHDSSYVRPKCNICKIVYAGRNSYRVHMLRNHGAASVPKNKPGRITRATRHLANPVVVGTDVTRSTRSLACQICGTIVSSAAYLNTHMKWKHERPFMRHKCSHCDMEFAHKNSLKQHMRNIHSAAKNSNGKSCIRATRSSRRNGTSQPSEICVESIHESVTPEIVEISVPVMAAHGTSTLEACNDSQPEGVISDETHFPNLWVHAEPNRESNSSVYLSCCLCTRRFTKTVDYALHLLRDHADYDNDTKHEANSTQYYFETSTYTPKLPSSPISIDVDEDDIPPSSKSSHSYRPDDEENIANTTVDDNQSDIDVDLDQPFVCLDNLLRDLKRP